MAAWKHRRRGASRTEVMTSSVSDGMSSVTTGLLVTVTVLLLLLQDLQIVVELTHTLLPVLPVALDPVGRLFEGRRLQPAGPPLRLPPLADEPGPLQHLQVLRDRGQLQLERPG